MPASELRVLVVDDHRAFAEMLGFALSTTEGMTCLGVAADGAAAVAEVERLRPDAVVLDIGMPGDDGLVATRRIRRIAPGTAVVIVSAHRRPGWVVRAAHAGAAAYVVKDSPLREIVEALRAATPGRMVRPAWVGGRDAAVAGSVTQRELQVLDGLGSGVAVKHVARDLGMALPTCRGHLRTLMTKFGVGTQLEVVLRAQQLGLLPEPGER